MICRFREIHVVNEYGVFQAVYALVGEKAFERFPKKRLKIFFAKVRPFLTEKIRNRLQFHGSCRQNLHRSLGKIILPSDYGGDQVGLEQHRWQLHHWVSAAGGGWRWPGGVDRSSYQTLRLLFTFATTLCLSFRQILIFDATSERKLNFIGGML